MPYTNFVYKMTIFIETLSKDSCTGRQMQLNHIKYGYSISKPS